MNKYLVAPVAQNMEEAREFINKINKGIVNNQWIYRGITLKNDNRLMGTLCLWNLCLVENKPEIGYVLHPFWQGKGLMQEALDKVIRRGFDVMKLQAIEAVLNLANKRSIALPDRNGFVDEKELEEALVYRLINSINKPHL